jgi:hypothetical protein
MNTRHPDTELEAHLARLRPQEPGAGLEARIGSALRECRPEQKAGGLQDFWEKLLWGFGGVAIGAAAAFLVTTRVANVENASRNFSGKPSSSPFGQDLAGGGWNVNGEVFPDVILSEPVGEPTIEYTAWDRGEVRLTRHTPYSAVVSRTWREPESGAVVTVEVPSISVVRTPLSVQ